jgi:cytosine/adenosine deaminase-related metal-dependent hydrolase
MSDTTGTTRPNRYILEGRVITMGRAGVIPAGAIYIDGSTIHAVQDVAEPRPEGFERAPRVRTGGSIYPGLIELHNHLCYNSLPLWDVPRRFSNNGQWRNHSDYQRLITKPAQVLGRSPGVVEAMVRFSEMRCLLGGVTTSQGITLASAPGIRSYYRGVLRTVEQTGDPDLAPAGTRIANPDNGQAGAYLETLRNHSCYLQHLSEGVDQTARGWFLRLRLDDGKWAVTDSLCGIHSTALNGDDLRIIAERGGSIVWSPLSNYLLYGRTLDLKAAAESGVMMGIGCDWAPSGTKNLLGELKVAWLANQEAGEIFSPEQIVAMATRNAACILKWEAALGTLEPGKRADLICISGRQGDDYLRLIQARDTSITLVVVNGTARIGQPSLMAPFGPGTEKITVGRSNRVLNLEQDTTHPLIKGLSLTEATRRLQEAMQNLPSLAKELDNAFAMGLFGGSTDPTGMPWQVVLDFEEDGFDPFTQASQPLADFVEPMKLDGITVADDPAHLRALVAARNLPEFVKKGLPPLYGMKIPIPDSAEFLLADPEAVAPQVLGSIQDLKTFLRSWGELTLAERRTITEQARVLLEQNYVHLPLKRAMHAVDPLQRLRLLRYRLDEVDEGTAGPEMAFHQELAEIFMALRDLHTSYRLPSPFSEKTAWLPFLIEEYYEHERPHYLVTKVVGGAGPASFVPQVEVLYWNGMPIERAVELNAARQAGSNAAARLARGLNSLTIRPLSAGLPPDEEWVTLRYRGLDGQVHEYTQEWLVFEPGRGGFSLTPENAMTAATALGMDGYTDDIQEVKKVLYAPNIVRAEEQMLDEGELQPVQNTARGLATYLPTIFRATPVTTSRGTYGYIRIFTFNVNDDRVFVDEFVRLVNELPQNGLIIDVRGNGGGLIYAAERLLQVLTPDKIEPQRAQFINSALNLQICRKHHPSKLFRGFDLGEWIPSIQQSIATGATYSLGYPITSYEMCNDIGQQYFGNVVLITDALCYSATDIFAAGFEDHNIGPILGIHENTGAGGANVWSYELLRTLLDEPPGQERTYQALPRGAGFRVAVRRTIRVGKRAGDVVEDLGIRPTVVHRMTQKDLIFNNQDLLEEATRLLDGLPVRSLIVESQRIGQNRLDVKVRTAQINRLDVYLDQRPQQSLDVSRDVVQFSLKQRLPARAVLEVRGFDQDGKLVAAKRVNV